MLRTDSHRAAAACRHIWWATLLVSLGLISSAESETSFVWLDYTQKELDRAYDQSVYAPNLVQVLERQAANSEIARTHLGPPHKFSYGDGPNETLDVYSPAGTDAPIHIFIHGGTWRFGSAENNAFAAENLVDAGRHFVVLDFSSIEIWDGDLRPLVDQIRRAIIWVFRHGQASFGGDPKHIHLSGFSSGGHLAGVMATTDWTVYQLPADLFAGVTLVSGMYDLSPVALSSRREYVSFNPAIIEELSPIRHIKNLHAPVTVVYGTEETPEFIRQAQEFVDAVVAHGKEASLIVGPKLNHFELIETMASPFNVVGRVVRQ
ncbi:MAG: alpha/beta hydrolase [Synoicihabitans sp.]